MLKKEKGITLLALAVIIIILLILSGISLSNLKGKDGVIEEVKTTQELVIIEQYRSELEIILPELEMKKYIDDLTTRELMDIYDQRIREKKMFQQEGTQIFWKNSDRTVIRVITPEKYVFDCSIEGVEYKGQHDNAYVPNLQESDILFTYNPTEPTNKTVKVTIEVKNESLKDYELQYSLDANEWTKYTNEITIYDNGPIYARLVNELNESGTYATGNVSNIDRLAPNTFIPEITKTTNSITIAGETTDREATDKDACSGVKSYYFCIEKEGIEDVWEPSEGKREGNYTFNSLEQGKTYKLKMKAVDRAGNETVTEIKEVELEKNTVAYYIDTENVKTQQYVYGNSILNPSFTPTKSGWTFVGWKESDTSANGNVLTERKIGNETSTINLYAVFKQDITATFKRNTTENSIQQRYYNNGNLVNPSFTLPNGTNSDFSGWTWRGWSAINETTGNASVAYDNGASVTLSSNSTFYGLYSQAITLSYAGNGASSGSTASQSGTRYYNTSGNYTNPTFTLRNSGFSRLGYDFNGWSLGAAGTSVTLTANSTANANWYRKPTAYLYADGLLEFKHVDKPSSGHGSVVKTYTGWDTASYSIGSQTWIGSKASIKSVIIRTGALPQSTDNWFREFTALTSVVIENNGKQGASGSMCYDCKNVSTLSLGDSITTISAYGFEGCENLSNLRLPSKLTSIEKSAFKNCYRLASVKLPDTVTNVDVDAFYNCTGLNTLYLSRGMTTINISSFRNCTSLRTIYFPKNITRVSDNAFYSCSISRIYYEGTEANWNNIRIKENNGNFGSAAKTYNSRW